MFVYNSQIFIDVIVNPDFFILKEKYYLVNISYFNSDYTMIPY